MKKKIFYTLFLASFAGIISCKKLIQVDPPIDRLVSGNVYTANNTATAVTVGMFSQMADVIGSSFASMGLSTGLSADELTLYTSAAGLQPFYSNSLLSTSGIPSFWTEFYQRYIYTCNDVLTNLPNNSVSASVSTQLIGEAKFTRALCYFYLTNFWGDVPLLTSTDYQANALVPRTPSAQVYELIKQDLLDAQNLLNTNYIGPDALSGTTERTIPNKWAATALLARVYLYLGDWKNAELQATAVINNSDQYILQQDLNTVFLANNLEAIWQLPPVFSGIDSYDAVKYILLYPPTTGGSGVALSHFLLNSFEPGDKRRVNWVKDTVFTGTTYFYAYKYKINSPTTSKAEYTTILRLAEQYLIRAEAEANGAGNGVAGAVADLNAIRERAGLPDYNGPTDLNSLMAAILHERKVELFTEFGHRWLDLKRTKTIDTVMGAPGNVCQDKGGTWNSHWQLYPIPNSEILVDKNLTQNDGY